MNSVLQGLPLALVQPQVVLTNSLYFNNSADCCDIHGCSQVVAVLCASLEECGEHSCFEGMSPSDVTGVGMGPPDVARVGVGPPDVAAVGVGS